MRFEPVDFEMDMRILRPVDFQMDMRILRPVDFQMDMRIVRPVFFTMSTILTISPFPRFWQREFSILCG